MSGKSNSENKINGLSALVLGAAVGAAVTYLFTSKKGKEIRSQVLKEGKKLLEELQEEVQEKKEELEEAGEEVKHELEEKAQELKEDIKETAEEIPDHIEEVQEKGRRFFTRKSAQHAKES